MLKGIIDDTLDLHEILIIIFDLNEESKNKITEAKNKILINSIIVKLKEFLQIMRRIFSKNVYSYLAMNFSVINLMMNFITNL